MLIRVKVLAEAKKDEVVEKGEGKFEVKVKVRAVRGEANRAVINLLADYFQVSPARVKLIKGFKERNKIFEVNLGK